MPTIGVAEVLIRPSFKDFQKEVGKVVDGTSKGGKESGKGFGSGFSGAAKGALLGGAAAAAGGFALALTKGFGRLQSLENARAKLAGLGHDTKTVETIMNDALKSVKGTAFGMDEAATVAASAVASGVKPGKDLERTLKLVADASTIAGVPMNEMGAIFNKVAGTGKIQGEVLAQLGERGIPILQLLGKSLGETPESVQKMASEGKIGFEDFQKAMEQGMGGAALKSGDTLQGAFNNTLASIGRVGANLLSKVYPKFTEFFKGLLKLLEPVEEWAKKAGEAIGKFFDEQLVPFFATLWDWLGKNTPLLWSIAGAAAAFFTGLLIYKTVTGIIGFLAAARVAFLKLNAAMLANPIFIVIGLIALLVGALVYLYQTNEDARKFMDEAWAGIQKVIKIAWEQFIQPALKAIGDFLVNVLAPALVWFWQNVVVPTWNGISAAVKWAWENVIQPAFRAIEGFINNVLAPVFNWLYLNVIKPVWQGIVAAVTIAWGILDTIFRTIVWVVKNVLSPAFTWLYENIIKPVWDKVSKVITDAWEDVIQPALREFGNFFRDVLEPAFKKGVDAIKKIWNNVQRIAAAPINFVIGTVYNDGLRVALNKVREIVGGDALPRLGLIDVPAYATGGQMRNGWKLVGEEGPELIHTGPGYVYTANETKRMLASQQQAPMDALDTLNGGRSKNSPLPIGGWLEELGNFGRDTVRNIGNGLDWVRGGLADVASMLLNPVKDAIKTLLPGENAFPDIARRASTGAIDAAISWIRGKDQMTGDFGGGAGGYFGYDGPLGNFYRPRGVITSGFGASRGRYPHAGIDFASAVGTPFRAMYNGIVRKAGWNIVAGRTGIGQLIDHANGISTYVGHLSKVLAGAGSRVKGGQITALTGNTGKSTGPHAHVEMWKNGQPFNWAGYLQRGGGGPIKAFANGGRASGWSLVGEQGPELVNFSSPGNVFTARDSAGLTALLGALSNASNSQSFDAINASLAASRTPSRMELVLENGQRLSGYVREVAGSQLDELARDARRVVRAR
ncbi:tape measure domain-containing protein [Neomicrococcus aestuarii]|uniref:Tape measure domain-containing protein n=1 Tax=Neomicrococcus aestuarii TaxID=556325 RepID=A0A7W8X238_9MICC|nr:peptidoglycan DD-metalloendopeptidase family protein [Neomicrococcus aestuarii]MBB5513484.1 tape measure domain-containing protein [Neomicrococcus aestuarii]